MGLSDEERYTKVVWAISHMNKEIEELQERVGKYQKLDKKLVQMVRQLWSALRGNKGNALHWILGSGNFDEAVQPKGLLNVALIAHGENLKPVYMEHMDRQERRKDSLVHFRSEYFPTPYKLLQESHEGHERATAYLLYELCENIFYAINRYPGDKFAKAMVGVRDLASLIQGYVFTNYFSRYNIYLDVHLFVNILEKLWTYDETDTVNKWIRKVCLHHHLKTDLVRTHELMLIWKRLQFKQPTQISSEERLLLLLKLVGRRFHYDHQHKELYGILKEHNKGHEKDQIDIEKAKEACKAAAEAHKDYEKNSGKNYSEDRYCYLTGKHGREDYNDSFYRELEKQERGEKEWWQEEDEESEDVTEEEKEESSVSAENPSPPETPPSPEPASGIAVAEIPLQPGEVVVDGLMDIITGNVEPEREQ